MVQVIKGLHELYLRSLSNLYSLYLAKKIMDKISLSNKSFKLHQSKSFKAFKFQRVTLIRVVLEVLIVP